MRGVVGGKKRAVQGQIEETFGKGMEDGKENGTSYTGG